MTDRPILFSAPMVRALLAGTKTQTRRQLSRSWSVLGESWRHKSAPWDGLDFGRAIARDTNTLAMALCGADAWPDPHLDVPFLHPDDAASGGKWEDDELWYRVRPPLEVGDRLWVKETWRTWRDHDAVKPVDLPQFNAPVFYEADRDNCARHGKVRVSIHMPRWASRLTLAVTDIRVQRLQDISTADVLAEGAPLDPNHRDGTQDGSNVYMCMGETPHTRQSPRAWYHRLWDSINGEGAWDANPWVVAVSFDVLGGNIDA
jgi:hypothetical protein